MSFGIPVRNGLAIGLLSSTMLSSRAGMSAALMLNFLTGSLDPRITFSRGSQATLTDSTGKITYAPNNLLTNSESFENAAWAVADTTVTSNFSTAPNGSTTADRLTEAATTAVHAISQTVATLAATSHVFSVYLKKGSGATAPDWVQLTFGGASTGYANFNISTGVVGVTSSATASISSVGSGWYRCSIAVTVATAGSASVQVVFTNNTDSATRRPSYAGATTSDVLVWGAQLEQVTYQTTPGTYNSTTPKNLLGYTQEFDNAAWTKTAATITANSVAAPDGTLTADTITEDTTAASAHRVFQSITTVAAPYTASMYVKAGTRSWFYIRLTDSGNTQRYAYFNVSTGALGTVETNLTASITSVGNGWYRCAATVNAALAGSNPIIFAITDANGNSVYNGNGTGSIYIWGAQLSNSASVDPYVYNPGAAPTSAAYYGPRFDYDPVTLAAKGLLIEEQRSNLVLYSQDFTNAAWTKTDTTVTAASGTAPDGTNTATLLTQGSAGTAEVWQSFTITAGNTLTYSRYVKPGSARWYMMQVRNGGSTSFAYAWFDLTNGVVGSTSSTGGFATISGSTMTAVGNGWFRLTFTVMIGASFSSAVLSGNSVTANSTGTPVNGGTRYEWGSQAEVGAFATSYIPTVASQVTRSADVATMTGANFSSWYNQNEGTFATSYIPFNVSGTYGVLSANGGSSTNGTDIRAAGTSNVVTGGVLQAQLTATGITANAVDKLVLSYATNNFWLSGNGGSPVGDTSGTVPTVDRLQIGNLVGLTAYALNGYIRSITYYNYRMPNALLQRITV